jgi:hypothetical protein
VAKQRQTDPDAAIALLDIDVRDPKAVTTGEGAEKEESEREPDNLPSLMASVPKIGGWA